MPLLDVVTSAEPAQLHYEDHGHGRPVVLIHGWPLSGRSWEPQEAALIDAGYRVITYDRRGFGWSSQTWTGYDYDTFTADLDALLEHLDVHDVTLVGFSMGGGEVARYLSRYGTVRVSQAVFAAAVPPFLFQSDDNPDGGLDDETIAGFESGVQGDRAAFLESFVATFFTAGDRDDLVGAAAQRYHRTIAEFASPKGTLDCIAAFGRTDFRADLATITLPTLVIHGDSDGIVPFEVSGKRTHEAIAGSTLVLIEGGPHGLNLSHRDEFNAALIDFLNSGAAGGETGRHVAPEPEQSQQVEPVAVPVPDVASEPSAVTAADLSDAPATPDRPAWPLSREADDSAIIPSDVPVTPDNVRAGWVADPNLGDIPVDEQPH